MVLAIPTTSQLSAAAAAAQTRAGNHIKSIILNRVRWKI